jgi:hypothetical protein
MMSTIIHGHVNSPKPSKSGLAEAFHGHIWNNDFPKYGRDAYKKHNDGVRTFTHGRNLLEYQVKDGWGPLCEFLEIEAPTTPFPRADDWLEYKKAHGTV